MPVLGVWVRIPCFSVVLSALGFSLGDHTDLWHCSLRNCMCHVIQPCVDLLGALEHTKHGTVTLVQQNQILEQTARWVQY